MLDAVARFFRSIRWQTKKAPPTFSEIEVREQRVIRGEEWTPKQAYLHTIGLTWTTIRPGAADGLRSVRMRTIQAPPGATLERFMEQVSSEVLDARDNVVEMAWRQYLGAKFGGSVDLTRVRAGTYRYRSGYGVARSGQFQAQDLAGTLMRSRRLRPLLETRAPFDFELREYLPTVAVDRPTRVHAPEVTCLPKPERQRRLGHPHLLRQGVRRQPPRSHHPLDHPGLELLRVSLLLLLLGPFPDRPLLPSSRSSAAQPRRQLS